LPPRAALLVPGPKGFLSDRLARRRPRRLACGCGRSRHAGREKLNAPAMSSIRHRVSHHPRMDYLTNRAFHFALPRPELSGTCRISVFHADF